MKAQSKFGLRFLARRARLSAAAIVFGALTLPNIETAFASEIEIGSPRPLIPVGAFVYSDSTGLCAQNFPGVELTKVGSRVAVGVAISYDGIAGKPTDYITRYKLGGPFAGSNLECGETVGLLKPFAFIEAKQRDAIAQATISVASRLAACSLGGVKGCLSYLVILSQGSESPIIVWLDRAQILLDIIRAGINPPALIVSSYLEVQALMFEELAKESQKLANDPPDPQYNELYESQVETPEIDWGMSGAANTLMNEVHSRLVRLYQSERGYLVSLERFQGAIQANDQEWRERQYQAMQRFALDSENLRDEVADLLDSLPAVFQSEGISDVPFDAAELEANLDEIETTGFPSDLLQQLVEFSGDPEIGAKLSETALTLRGQTLSQSLYDSLHAIAASLRISRDPLADTDVDNVLDGQDNCVQTRNAQQGDEDLDGIGDACDHCPVSESDSQVGAFGCPIEDPVIDSDDDGVADGVDACPNTLPGQAVNASGCSAAQRDTDSDGVLDNVDNCPANANSSQSNFDNDGLGDACDPDIDNDSVLNGPDQCDATPVADRSKVDATGCVPPPRACDVDVDRDIDWLDIKLIVKAIGQKASGSADPRDANRNGRIDLRDPIICTGKCDRNWCKSP